VARVLFILVVVLALISNPAKAVFNAQDVNTFTLKNGMTIAVIEDHSIPNANMYLFWKVGSRNEYPGITGLSHFFEHMMFNGSKKYGPKQFDRVMEANGGANNAYTTENVTVYTDWFPSDALEVIFDLEADRIANLDIDPKVVESERGVVTSERTTGLENSNFRMLHQEVKGAAFIAHPYMFPVIGFQSDIDNWSIEDLRQYHKTYYAPNNAYVVIAGDVKLSEVKRLAKKYFEPIPAQKPPRKIHTQEPEQKGERRVYVQKPSATSPNVMLAYHVPATKDKDFYPLAMLSSILGDGASSRLHRYLVEEKQLATNVFTYLPESFDPNLFYIYAIAAKGVSAQQLESGIIEVINEVMEKGVQEKELVKVKNKTKVDFYRTIATINGKANTLGSFQLYYGDYQKLFTLVEDMNKVSAEDIKRVANTYLLRKNRTVGILAKDVDSQQGDK
jgi:predicted Zn-dependent peptidase